ncbi:low molecular weight protein-tyrosine-phosphatase [Parvularcula sp. LCG005]|uniref:low molecular weight protein-tyrosine-phosphatase n=1 Tax=Parvularcula sp. LCG005 TaxID=3078805 RepID=UPI00294210DD|nr:low molecular weight protein-tyrosine-phosphatase [Parvularcula sp. LCG005]WOI53411.1 low molecular weight protein-tyrosine-phosphatase [Parvularcula sp. LCG005]
MPRKVPEILCVCLGNICRSPAAEGVLRDRLTAATIDAVIDSAGTGGWHRGNPPDRRMIAAARARGLDLTGQRARQVDVGDFYVFDFILAMDSQNFADLQDLAPRDGTASLHKFLDFANGGDVPDPYYGGADGFETVLDLLEEASDGFIRYLTEWQSGA